MQHIALHELVIVRVVLKCVPCGKFLFDKCSCILIKLRKTPEFNFSQYVCIFESCKSSSMVLCCHLLRLLSSFIYCECKHMSSQVGGEAIAQTVSSGRAAGLHTPDALKPLL